MMAGSLPKDPQRAWRNVIAAVEKAMAAMGAHGVGELRSELAAYQRNLGCSPAERRPQGEVSRQACQQVWDALLGMRWENPLDVLDKVKEEFSMEPDLEDMKRAVGRYDQAHPPPGEAVGDGEEELL